MVEYKIVRLDGGDQAIENSLNLLGYEDWKVVDVFLIAKDRGRAMVTPSPGENVQFLVLLERPRILAGEVG